MARDATRWCPECKSVQEFIGEVCYRCGWRPPCMGCGRSVPPKKKATARFHDDACRARYHTRRQRGGVIEQLVHMPEPDFRRTLREVMQWREQLAAKKAKRVPAAGGRLRVRW